MTESKSDRWLALLRDPTCLGVAAILLVATALRLRGWGDYWLNSDEGTYYLIAHTEDWGLFRQRVASHAHPPLYYALLWVQASLGLGGIGALRAPSLLAGLALVPAVAALARRLGGVPTALTAALFVALSPTAVILSQVIRPYMFLALTLTLAVWGWLGWEGEARRGRDLGVFAVCGGLALATHYSALLVVAAAGGVSLARWWRRGRPRAELRPLLLTFGALGVLGLGLLLLHVFPVLLGSRLRREATQGWLRLFFVSGPTTAWLSLAGALAFPLGLASLAPTLLCWGAGLLAWAREPARRSFLALVLLTLALAVLLSALGLYPLGYSRHAVYLLPFVAVGAARGIELLLGWAEDQRWDRFGLGLALFTVLVAFRGELADRLGLTSFYASMLERELRREPIEEQLLPALEELRESEGLLVLPLSAAYPFSPVWGDAWSAPLSEELSWFTWGKRTVVISPAWRLRTEGSAAEGGLDGTCEALAGLLPQGEAALAGPVHVVSVEGWLALLLSEQVAPADERLIVDDYAQLFRIDVAALRAQAEDEGGEPAAR